MTPIPVLAIVLNWRQPEMTIECVHVLQSSDYSALDILVIDNGSGEGSVQILLSNLPDIKVVSLPENVGFARGCNLGIRWAQDNGYRWVFLLNNDAFVTPTTLTTLMRVASSDVALASPKIFFEQYPKYLWFAGGRQHPRLLEMRDTGQGQLDGPRWQQTRDVDYLVGTGLLVNIAVVFRAGLFDESYFMYYEDLDWCIRLRQAGFKLRLVANAHLYHRVSFSSGGTNSPTQLYYLAYSSIIFFYRHACLGNPMLILAFRLGSACKKIATLLGRGQKEAVIAYLRGLRDGWHAIKKGKGIIPLP